MKKNFILLTGIVFVIAVLAAGGCSSSANKTETSEEADPNDATTVTIFLKDRLINDSMHLELSDTRKPGCVVIDNLETFVKPGDTVIFEKAQNSKVKEVIDIVLEYEVPGIISEEFSLFGDSDSGLYVLIIDTIAPKDTIIVKYDIEFKVKKDTFKIDPYLRIPPQSGGS